MRADQKRDLVTRSRRAMRWLQPGLVVKRWVLTSGLGLLMALLGGAVWADLKPIYWILETLSWFLGTITTVLPREITGPLVVLVGVGLVLWGQSRSFGSIQQALAPDKDTVLVDALRAKNGNTVTSGSPSSNTCRTGWVAPPWEPTSLRTRPSSASGRSKDIFGRTMSRRGAKPHTTK